MSRCGAAAMVLIQDIYRAGFFVGYTIPTANGPTSVGLRSDFRPGAG